MTAIVPNGQIDLHYTRSGFEHVLQLRCVIDNPTGVGPYNLVNQASSAAVWTTASDLLVTRVAAVLPTTETITFCVLQYYNGSTYEQLDIKSYGTAGGVSAATVLASEITLTFKDGANRLMKVTLLECAGEVPVQIPYATLPGAFGTLVDSLLTLTSGNLGYWFKSKGGDVPKRFIFFTASINKRLQRKRNLG